MKLWHALVLLALATPLAAGAEVPALLFTGNVRGELASCACSRTPPGGVARRKTLVDRQLSRGPVALAEAGDALFFDLAAPNAEARRRAIYFLELMGRTGTAALAAGPHDLAAGASFLKREAARARVPVLSANLTSKGRRVFPASAVASVGAAQVAFIGVSAEGPAPGEGGAVGAPALAAVQQALQRLGPRDATVVLAAGGWEQAEALAKALEGQVTAVISSGEQMPARSPQRVGSTWLLAAAPHGQALGRLELTRTAEPALDWLPLGLEVMEDDLVKAEVSALKPPAIYR